MNLIEDLYIRTVKRRNIVNEKWKVFSHYYEIYYRVQKFFLNNISLGKLLTQAYFGRASSLPHTSLPTY